MKIRAILLALLFVLSASPLFAADRRTDTTRLVIMTFNAEFLWDGVDPEEGQVEFLWKNSSTEAQERMRDIANVIIQSNPDIVNLVEVENLNTLQMLNNNFLQGRGYVPYLVKGRDTFTGQDVGLLTRIDPENDQIQRFNDSGRSGNTTKSVSKNYFAKIRVNDQTRLGLISIHFLARPLDESRRLQREAQADAMRTLARRLWSEGSLPVILGDFNDFDGGDGNRDHADNLPRSNVLQMLKDLDPSNTTDNLIKVSS